VAVTRPLSGSDGGGDGGRMHHPDGTVEDSLYLAVQVRMDRGHGVSVPWLEVAENVFVGGENGWACRGIPLANVLLLVGPVRADNVPLSGAPAEA
jgi:hypothetical protein